MSYPVSYRKGAMAMARAAKLPRLPGFQMVDLAALSRAAPWYPKVGGALRLFNLSAPGIVLGVGLAGIKFINWWQLRPEGLAGYELLQRCRPGRGGFFTLSLNNCTALYSPVAPASARDSIIFEHRPEYSIKHPALGWPAVYPIASWKRVVDAGPLPTQPGFRIPAVWFPTNVLAGEPAGVGPRPIAPPATVPVVPTLPESSVGGQPAAPTTVPRPMTGVYVWSPGGLRPVVSTVPTVRTVPDTLTQEKKLKMSKGLTSLILSFNATTEYADMVDALFDGLETSPCKSMAGPRPSTAVKADAIIRCAATQMNWSQAVFNLIWANVEDAVWAKMGLPTKEAGLPYGMNAPVNIAIGMAMGDSIADNFKVLKNRGSESVATVERITRKAVDILIASAQAS